VRIFTIGHSNHEFSKFVELLKSNDITTLVDVRTAPYSRYNPQFNKRRLEQELPRREIQYIFAGQYLGGRPSDPACYRRSSVPDENDDYVNEVDYSLVMQQAWFVKGINRLLELANMDTIAIMCAEEDPQNCHRHHLIARYIITKYPQFEIQHIRGDGCVYSVERVKQSLCNKEAKQLQLL
jgi:uncharacterized protein (DUF488 family)